MDLIKKFIKKRKITDVKILIFLLILSLVILSAVFYSRNAIGEPLIIGKESYHHFRIAESILNQESLKTFSAQEIILPQDSFNLFISGMMLFLEEKFIAVFLPILLGLLATFLFYSILREFNVKKEFAIFAVFSFIASNSFIYFFSIVNKESFALIITLLGILLFYKKSRIANIFSIIFFLLACTLSTFNSLLIIAILILFTKFKKPKRNFLISALVLLTFVMLLLRAPLLFSYSFTTSNMFLQIISDFGFLSGFSLFILMLAAIGFYTSWKNRKEIYPLYFLALFLVVFMLALDSSISIYISFLLSILAAKAICDIISLKWAVKTVRNLTFLLLICGFVFLVVSTAKQVVNLPPTSEDVRSLEFFRAIKTRDGLVFSDISNSFWIEGIAESKTFLNPIHQINPHFWEKRGLMETLFHSSNLKITKPIIDEYNIDYFWINGDMKQSIWKGQRKGLLFIFQNNETFKNIYNKENIEVWQYIGKHYEVS